MTQSVAQTAGVDISKDQLDVCLHPSGATSRFTNDARGLAALIVWLAPLAPVRIIFEATGAYHRAFERTLGGRNLPVVKINPRQARRFAEAVGTRAKTDRVDAAMLARFGASLEPPVRPIISATLDQMRQLHVARSALVKDRTATQNRQKNLGLALLKRQAARRLLQIKEQLDAIDAEFARLVRTDPDLQLRFNSLVSIPGVGDATALALLIEMPELGTLEHRQAASLAGLAPVTRESGQWKGRSFISGGRATLRQALYMPALVAIRFNADLKAKYQAMTAAGKPPKVAIITVMRKLIVLANALLKNPRLWTPKTA
ncbi:IS110 family transposase [Lichenicoccus sp.]|uniref:IS110 family transposase n=1 Tax=Lichenicoccus sp. TaxID=2781899 RepID=UPI003D0BC0F5